jgi:RecB family exonuclease
MTFQNLNDSQISLIQSHESTMDRIIESMASRSWDCVLLPSLFVIQCIRKKWLETYGTGLVPKMITYDHPLGHAQSSILQETPVSSSHGIAWSLDFFQSHFPDAINQGHRDLTGLARALMQLWEHIEHTSLHDQQGSKNHSLDSIIPESLRSGLLESGTPHVIHEWLKWWPDWLRNNGWCSHARSCFAAQKQALSWWKNHPDRPILCWIHNGEKTPWSWLRDLSHLPHFHSLLEDPTPRSAIQNRPDCLDASFISHGMGSQSIICETADEQARVIALLIRETLNQPDQSVGLIVSSSNLLMSISHVLKQYAIPLAIPKIPLITSLLRTIWQGSVAGWGRMELLNLLRQPLILKKYPIADQMAQWIERYTPDWTPESSEQSQTMAKKPRWLARLQRVLWAAVGTLTFTIKESLTSSAQSPCVFWIDLHIQALQDLLPSIYWDYPLVIEKIWQQRLSPLPPMDALSYGHWMLDLCETLFRKTDLHHDRIFVGTRDDIDCIAPNRCIMVVSTPPPLFPWMPKSWSTHFRIPQPTDNIVPPKINNSGDIWLISHQSSPTESLYRNLAKRIWQSPESLHLDAHNRPPARHSPAKRPYPPIHLLSISDLQRWHTDPEAFYQERILRIRSLTHSPQQIWGIAMHTLLDHFIRDFPPQQSFSMPEMLDGLQQLAAIFLPPMPWFQQSMRDKLLHQIVQCEVMHRQTGVIQSWTEKSGKMSFSLENGSISLVGRADRIDYLNDGTAHVIDYKTGTISPFVALDRMESIQLPLEGLMVQSGAMGQAMPVSKISWWSLHLTKGCQIRTYPRSVEKLLDRYAVILPQWLNQLAGGDYKNPPITGLL